MVMPKLFSVFIVLLDPPKIALSSPSILLCVAPIIAEELDFKKSSVSVAMKHLRENEHITVDSDGHIHLTESGRAIAGMIYERHQILSQWLMYLGVNEETALEDACRIEHVISNESFQALKKHIEGEKDQ